MSYKASLRRDPFTYLSDLRCRSADGIIQLPSGGWCVTDADLAHVLLRDAEFNGGRSGFFGELLPTRAAQVAVGHAVRTILRLHALEYRSALAEEVAALPTASRWPAAATGLIYRCLKNALLHPGTPIRTRQLVDQAVHGGIVFRAETAWQRARVEILRAKLIASITEEVRRRRESAAGEPSDVLDAILGVCPGELSDRTVTGVFLVLFRSIVAPVSTSLAWSVLLACLHTTSESPRPWPWPADWIVREAMRHRPMVWMVGRAIPQAKEFGGVSFQSGDILSVSPFLLHHDEHHWTDADAFRPERWAETGERGPYIPFGAGPFTCPGASVAHMLVTEALTALTAGAHLTAKGGDMRPMMAEGAVPRPFTILRTINE